MSGEGGVIYNTSNTDDVDILNVSHEPSVCRTMLPKYDQNRLILSSNFITHWEVD